MSCKRCLSNPVITLQSGKSLCKSCFTRYFEKKVNRTIREHKLIEKDDKIAVAISGGKDSLTVLSLLYNIALRKRDVEIFAILIDEGIKGYRDKTMLDAEEFCKKNGIKLHVFRYEDELGASLDIIIKKTGITGCTVCGVMRRYMLNVAARKLGAAKLATGHNLDDEAQSVMMNYLRNNMDVGARLGPITGIKRDKQFIRRIKPLYFMTEKETTVYAFLKGFLGKYAECPYADQSYRNDVRDMLNEFEQKHPGTKSAIIASFMEILPELKEKYGKESSKINHCPKCEEPTSGIICKRCQLVDEIKSKLKAFKAARIFA